ncbi:hypothetical protein OPV22_007907 [Ensete ventricosum]|uniref:CTLH domain-containing protein n=1 Tax=Ensete ventricosum TaxID=4639 RepID=A0AAV8R7J2_ENSVE|nr:hypothetical protein OPV22_007907 [Ensete ventricosum]
MSFKMWGRKGRCLVLKVRMTVLPLRSGGERLGVEIPEKPLIRPYYCRQSDMAFGRELVFLILQFLDEEKFKDAVHKLEQESGFYFNMKHFEDLIQAGEWDEVEKYLGGFTKVEDNRYSMKIFFEIRKQKYLEALDRHDRAKAVQILVKDLKLFASFNEELFKEITVLLTLENFRQNEQLSNFSLTNTNQPKS